MAGPMGRTSVADGADFAFSGNITRNTHRLWNSDREDEVPPFFKPESKKFIFTRFFLMANVKIDSWPNALTRARDSLRLTWKFQKRPELNNEKNHG